MLKIRNATPRAAAAFGSRGRRAGNKLVYGLALALAAPALVAAQAQAQAPLPALERGANPAQLARAKSTASFSELSVKGTNGYRITVYRFGDRQVSLNARKGKARKFVSATYTVTGNRGAERLRARFGEFGRIDMRFKPKGKVRKEKPRGCKGTPDKVRRGVWKGVLRFKGEDGYTKVNVTSARGSVTRFGDYLCEGKHSGPTPQFVLLRAWRNAPKSSTDFAVVQNDRPNARPQFSVRYESKIGGVEIAQDAFLRGRPSQFHFTAPEESGNADVKPRSPFSGSARYRGGSWKGNLKVKLPHGKVKLTGRRFKAQLTLVGGD